MLQSIYKLNKKSSVFNIFKKDIVFTISFLLAILSSFMYTPKIEYIDFKVLISLFNLMLVVKAFEELKILDKFAVDIINKCSNQRKVSLILIVLCFFSSMFITNDVALITFVPLALIISKKTETPMVDTIIFQTLAANIGSSLTPMGNPQNLFIYSYYKLTVGQFFSTVGIFVVLGALVLLVLNIRIRKQNLQVKLPSIEVENKKEAIVWAVVFAIITASILGVVSYKLAFVITLLTVLISNKNLLAKIDYPLLVTFIGFFIFIGNLSHVEAVHSYMREHLQSTASVYFGSILTSQFISNVPSALLLSKFTDNWRALLLGVNLGGMGTLIASLASVISYKLFVKENPSSGKGYMIRFSMYNFLGLIFLAGISYFILIVFNLG